MSTESKMHQHKKSPKDIFFLVTTIIGLFADLLGLVTFIGGLWSFGDQISTALRPAFIVISILIIFYGWIGLSWIVYKNTANEQSATFFGGTIVYPLVLIWITAITAPDERMTAVVAAVLPGILVFMLIGMGISHAIAGLDGQTEFRNRQESKSLLDLISEKPLPDLSDTQGDWLVMADCVKRLLVETYPSSKGTTLESIESVDGDRATLTYAHWYDNELYHIALTVTITGQVIDFQRSIY
jgi:hypothetical protein